VWQRYPLFGSGVKPVLQLLFRAPHSSQLSFRMGFLIQQSSQRNYLFWANSGLVGC
jgi:hypothetical protein